MPLPFLLDRRGMLQVLLPLAMTAAALEEAGDCPHLHRKAEAPMRAPALMLLRLLRRQELDRLGGAQCSALWLWRQGFLGLPRPVVHRLHRQQQAVAPRLRPLRPRQRC